MKKLIYISSLALFLAVLASCQKEDIRPYSDGEDVVVESEIFSENGTRNQNDGSITGGTNGITDPDEDEDFDEDEDEVDNIVDPDEDEDFDEDEDGK